MTIDDQIKQSEILKQRTAILFGALAGLVFGIVAWGYDAVQLALAHAILPWLTFVLGTVPCMLVGAAAAWITARLNRILAGLIIWILAGLAFAYLASHVAFGPQTTALRLLAPEIGARVSYPYTTTFQGHAIVIFIIITLVAALTGLLSNYAIDSAAQASTSFARIFTALIWCVLFAVAGYATEDNFSAFFRPPVVMANHTIQFALDHEGQTVDDATARALNLQALNPIRDLINRPRGLILAGYDETLESYDVLINFDGALAHCTVFAAWVNVCEKIQK